MDAFLTTLLLRIYSPRDNHGGCLEHMRALYHLLTALKTLYHRGSGQTEVGAMVAHTTVETKYASCLPTFHKFPIHALVFRGARPPATGLY